jgi:hypothetical protein
MMKKVALFSFLFLQIVRLHANPFDNFLNLYHISQNDTVKLFLFNADVNNCVKCSAIGSVIEDKLNDQNNSFIIIHGVNRSNLNYYAKKVLHWNATHILILSNDSLFSFFSPRYESRMVVSVGPEVYFSKSILDVKTPFNISSLGLRKAPIDSFEFKQNMLPVDCSNASLIDLHNGNLLFFDRLFRNAIVYNNHGEQLKSLVIDSADVKEIYDMAIPNEDNWDWAYRMMQLSKNMVPVPYELLNFSASDDKIYVLISYNFPKLKLPNTVSYEIWGLAIVEYDKKYNILNKYLVGGLPQIEKIGYYINSRPSFACTQDSLYINFTKISKTGETISDTSARFFGVFYKTSEGSKFLPKRICGKMPNDSWSDLKTDPSLYLSNKIDLIGDSSAVGVFKNVPVIYNFTNQKSITFKDLTGNKSVEKNENEFQFYYYFVENKGSIHHLPFQHLIYSENGKFYNVTLDLQGRVTNKNLLQLHLKKGDTFTMCLSDNILYIITLQNEDNLNNNRLTAYKYLISD